MYSFALLNNDFGQIDLSSLEEISYGGVVWADNPNLCYAGNLSLYVDRDTLNSTAEFADECPPSSRRRSSDICGECFAE